MGADGSAVRQVTHTDTGYLLSGFSSSGRGVSPGKGWVLDLPSLTANIWTPVVVSFDGDWTEAEARANGWMPDNEHPILSPNAGASNTWSETVANVRAFSIRLSGIGTPLTSGIDNFVLDSFVTPIPEPSTALLFGLGLAGLAGAGGRRR